MVEFGTGYYHPLDRDYGSAKIDDTSTNDVGVGIKDIGMSIPMGIAAPNVQGINSKIRTGARVLEIQFPGAGRGQRQAQTPGMYGKLQRQAIEELSRVNQVDFTTHASMGVMGLAGMDQQGNFNKQNKKMAVDEIKRAIEFAADVARGGNVVVHTGEFQRPISEEKWAQDPTAPEGYRFKMYGEEPEKAIIRVVDDRTGQIATQVRKDQRVAKPIWNKAEKDYDWTDTKTGQAYHVKKGDYIDYEDNKIDPELRMPKYDPKTGRFLVKYWDWNKFVEEAKERTARAREFWRAHKGNPAAFKDTAWEMFRDATSEDKIEVLPEEAYVQATLETNAGNARGWSIYYGGGYDRAVRNLTKLRKAKKLYEKLEQAIPEEEKWKIKKTLQSEEFAGLVPPETLYPTELLDRAIRSSERTIEQAREASSSQLQQARDAEETMRHVMSSRRYALKESYGAYAESGIKAMLESQKIEKQGKLKQPIFVSMENIFPESYGSHPDELMNLVEGSRKRMAQMLVKRGYAQEEARKRAQDHIKAHIDTGHLNTWRKYWNDDPKKAPEQNDNDFKNWILKKTEEMAQKQIIGSVHLTDNYGYQDDHLSPGEGTTPVREMVKIMKKHGYKGPLVVEPGADATTDLSDFHGLMKTWRLFGSPIYGVGAGRAPSRSRQWGQVQYSYFGQTQPPYFVFGKYSPSEDWTLWSGVPVE